MAEIQPSHLADILSARLTFIKDVEGLKNVLRASRTSTGRVESTAEHSWRLCVLAWVVADQAPELDLLKILKLCLIHDLGELYMGDVPAPAAGSVPDKASRERRDLQKVTAALPPVLSSEMRDLWEEYELAASHEARLVKGLDKLETIIQHNQGRNAPDFDYGFNLAYGQRYTDAHPALAALRLLVDRETRSRMKDAEAADSLPEKSTGD